MTLRDFLNSQEENKYKCENNIQSIKNYYWVKFRL